MIFGVPKFKFCSVFSAKNPTVNDAGGVTMLSVRSCSRGGDDFWCASRTTTVRYMFLFLSVIPDNV